MAKIGFRGEYTVGGDEDDDEDYEEESEVVAEGSISQLTDCSEEEEVETHDDLLDSVIRVLLIGAGLAAGWGVSIGMLLERLTS